MKPTLTFDLEIYGTYFLCMFRNIATGNVRHFEMFDGQEFDIATVTRILRQSTIVGFNSLNFDMPLLTMALSGADCAKIKRACDSIIKNNMRGWQLERKYNFKIMPDLDHIDLIEVAPGMASLKIYGGRMHCPKMQDLPIEPDAVIAPDQRQGLREYCANDLYVTEMLYRRLLPQIELRQQMSLEYGMELRSKSDAQIAEVVLSSEVSKIRGEPVVRPVVDTGTEFHFRAPAYITFVSEELTDILERVQSDPFVVSDTGKVNEPDWMKTQTVKIGGSVYKMGIGGLHSTESRVAHHADDDTVLIDRDVRAYYPSIILSQGYRPRHMGEAFTQVYNGIVDTRISAKLRSQVIEKRLAEIESELSK